MSKPEWCPQDVWDNAEIALKFVPAGDDAAQIASIARAILEAEQRGRRMGMEESAEIAKARKDLYGLEGSNACSEIASSILGQMTKAGK